jgi:Phosphotransferase enzyme family
VTQRAGAPKPRIGTAELRAVLEEALSLRSGTQRRVAGLERWPSIYSTSFAIEELDVHLDDGTSLRLLFKDLSQDAMLESARRVKPAFLYDPIREIETYRTILESQGLGTAACYGAIVDHRAGRYGLLLEKVRGVELRRVGDLATWQKVARWLGVMHTRFMGETERLAGVARLLRYDADYYRLWIERARTAPNRAGSSQPGAVHHSGMERLARRYDRLVERLEALPATFIHGEFYASNVLVDETEGKLRVCPVDWEMAAMGPGPIDLAALVAGGWNADEKKALTLAYYAALEPGDGWPPAMGEFLTVLDHCRLHLAVQWLGWASGWSPPPKHTQDWLGEALSLANKLELM